jgi:putative transposase
MPRYRRLIAQGSVQHVVSRFVNHEFRFDTMHARAEYLRRAALALGRADWSALGFALMSSHVHWAMRAGERPSSAVIKPLHAGFAGWLNVKQGRVGPVFADRHRTLTFEADTAAALLAYIHNNPVRAGVVADPADSEWTSHRAYLGLTPAPGWLDVERGLDLCGFSATPSGRLRFHEMVVARSSEARRLDLSGGDMHERRRAVRTYACAPLEIATPVVGLRAGALCVEASTDPLHPRHPQRAWRGSAATVLNAVAQAAGMPVAELQSRSRAWSIARARRVALLLWTRELRRPTVDLARILGLSSSAASEAMRTASAQDAEMAAVLATTLRGEQPDKTELPRTVP